MTMVGVTGVAATARAVRCNRRAREAFVEYLGEDQAARRQAEIEALPTSEWRGQQLHTIRCYGTTGRGPHDCNVPDSLLWALMSLRDFRCPYHPFVARQEPGHRVRSRSNGLQVVAATSLAADKKPRG